MTRIDIEQVKKMRAKMAQNGPMFKGGKYVEAKPESKYEKKLSAWKAKALKQEIEPHLFYFSVYSYIADDNFKTLSESEAKDKLKEFPEMVCYFCRVMNSTESAPAILKGRKNLHTEEVEGHEQLSELIFQRTNVKIKEADLMTKQMRAWKGKTLAQKIVLMNQVEKPAKNLTGKYKFFAKVTEGMERNAKYVKIR